LGFYETFSNVLVFETKWFGTALLFCADELLFQAALVTLGTCFLHIYLSKTWFCLIKIQLMIATNNNPHKILFEKKKY
jgi:hypothetical protein